MLKIPEEELDAPVEDCPIVEADMPEDTAEVELVGVTALASVEEEDDWPVELFPV